MAKKEAKKKSKVKFDSILVLLIAILIIAIVALGIVFVITLKTPDTQEVPKNENEITETTGTYSDYLETKLSAKEYKELPITSRLKSGNSGVLYTKAVLGTDSNLYLVSEDNSGEEIPGGTINGKNYNLKDVVDIFAAETTNMFYVFALTADGKVYNVDLTASDLSGEKTSYTSQKNIVEIYANGDFVEAKLFDDSTVIISQ